MPIEECRRVRVLMSDPESYSAWKQQFSAGASKVLRDLAPALDDLRARAGRPADDDAFGRIVRRLATANEFRLRYLETLLDWWERVDSGVADDHERDLVSKVQGLLNSIQKVPDEGALESGEC